METGICKLCQQTQNLCKSHIVPEFAYKPLYDKKGRYLITSKKDYSINQKGLYECLFCKNCESLFSKYEKILKKELDKMVSKIESQSPVDRIEYFNFNVNYKPIKLSILIILFRMHVSTHKEFNTYNLGPYAEKIRQLIVSENAQNPENYPILISRFLIESKDFNKHHKDYQSYNIPTKFNKKHTIQSFAFYGFYFYILISENYIDSDLSSLFLKEKTICVWNTSSFDKFPLESEQYKYLKTKRLESLFKKLDY
jgi:hypothetical protein